MFLVLAQPGYLGLKGRELVVVVVVVWVDVKMSQQQSGKLILLILNNDGGYMPAVHRQTYSPSPLV